MFNDQSLTLVLYRWNLVEYPDSFPSITCASRENLDDQNEDATSSGNFSAITCDVSIIQVIWSFSITCNLVFTRFYVSAYTDIGVGALYYVFMCDTGVRPTGFFVTFRICHYMFGH